jgi:hypothetical protein
MGRGDYAGVYEGVETVDDELGTLEAEHRGCCLAGDMLHEEGESEGFPLHLGGNG